jgi:hypothetical protein
MTNKTCVIKNRFGWVKVPKFNYLFVVRAALRMIKSQLGSKSDKKNIINMILSVSIKTLNGVKI